MSGKSIGRVTGAEAAHRWGPLSIEAASMYDALAQTLRLMSLLVIVYALIGMQGVARADEEIPSYKVLPCTEECPDVVPAVLTSEARTAWPVEYRPENYTRDRMPGAMVDVAYTIAPDGAVSRAEITDLIGPEEFGDSALAEVRARKFKPATENGKPVEENRRVEFLFQTGIAAARESVAHRYYRATNLATGGHRAEAIAALNDIEAEPDLNLYERTMTAYALAVLYGQGQDLMQARDAIELATINEARYLGRRDREQAIRLRIQLEAATGEFEDAFAWFEILKKLGEVSKTDATSLLVDRLHAAIAGPGALVAGAIVPDKKSNEFWQHTMLRRSFEFKEVQGTLDRFELRCDTHGIESAVSTKANWTIPKSWSNCRIYVYGSPKVKFQFFELNV